jgi:tryptophan synthase beta chain
VKQFNLSGHGHFDLASNEAYLAVKLKEFKYPAEKVKATQAELPQVKIPA